MDSRVHVLGNSDHQFNNNLFIRTVIYFWLCFLLGVMRGCILLCLLVTRVTTLTLMFLIPPPPKKKRNLKTNSISRSNYWERSM
jgi:hypothetical protein